MKGQNLCFYQYLFHLNGERAFHDIFKHKWNVDSQSQTQMEEKKPLIIISFKGNLGFEQMRLPFADHSTELCMSFLE